MSTLRVTLAAFALLGGMTGLALAQVFAETQKLLASDGVIGDQLGFYSVAISGNLAVIGAKGDDDKGLESGSAYVFDASTGQQLSKLTASDGAADDYFGISVAISGNLAVIGARGDDDKGLESGSAYVFDVTTGQQLSKLTASGGAAYDLFGNFVAISGNLAVIGAYRDDDKGSDSGSAYVFDVTTGQQLSKLTASDGAAGDSFGWSVAISSNLAVIGAILDDDKGTSSGSAYVFDASTGQQLSKLTASDGAAGDYFGSSVTISGNLAVIGASGDADKGPSTGSAYVFDVTTGQQLHKLTASDGAAGDLFGHSVAISGNLAVIGAFGDDDKGDQSGLAYVFDASTGQQLSKLTASDGAASDQFGDSVAISGNLAVIGAYGDDDKGSYSGSAYVFESSTPPVVHYGTGCLGTGGIVPALAMSGSATPGGAVQLDILNGVGSGTAFIFMGLQQASTYMGFGCTLNVSPLLPVIVGPIPLFPFGAQGAGAGSISIPATLPASITPPITLTLQAFINDPGGKGGYSNTNGVQMDIQ